LPNRSSGVAEHVLLPPLGVAYSPDGKTLLVGCGYRDATSPAMKGDELNKAGVHVYSLVEDH
jgi:hypothetical protein